MRRGRILILLGLILAIGTAIAVVVIMRSQGTTPTATIELEKVVVAIQPIAEEEPVGGKIDLREMPKEYLPPDALRSLEGTADLLAAGPIPQGTVIHPDLLITAVELMQQGELGKLIEPGYVAVALPIDELSSVSYGVKPGDHVDVMMTFFFVDLDQETQVSEPLCDPICPVGGGEEQAGTTKEQRPRLATQLTLQDITVLGVGRWIKEQVPQEEQDNQARTGEPVPVQLPEYVTIMVSPQDALVLKMAREDNAAIDLAVRAKDDGQQFTTQQVTLDYIMARFGVTLPAKQPYSLFGINTERPQPEQ